MYAIRSYYETLLAMTLALGLPLATYAVAETAPAPSAARNNFV